MKLCWKLHETAEMYTDTSPEETGKVLQTAIDTQFLGNEDGGSWILTRKDRNVFRPAISLKLLPDADGTQILVDYRVEKLLLSFMCIWSVIVVGLSYMKGWLLLVTLPLFWGAVLVGFSKGVQAANRDFMTLFGAYEIDE